MPKREKECRKRALTNARFLFPEIAALRPAAAPGRLRRGAVPRKAQRTAAASKRRSHTAPAQARAVCGAAEIPRRTGPSRPTSQTDESLSETSFFNVKSLVSRKLSLFLAKFRQSVIKQEENMVILVLNCGSSSIKYQVIDMEGSGSKLLAKGLVERIGLDEGILTHKPVGRENFELHRAIPDHTTGIRLVLDALVDPAHGVVESLDRIKAVGHRVAHGGEFFPQSCIVDEEAKRKIRSLFDIAPLHNPANLEGVLSIEKVLPGVPQVTVFDTSFHQTIPPMNYLYALPHAYYEKYRVRKYGFHGTSHHYVARKGAELAGVDYEKSNIITCHIGNGASVTAIRDGKSFDTSMGFSPLDGLVMGSRCGAVDASAITFIGAKEGMTFAQIDEMMNKRSGVLGLTDLSSDMRDIDKAYDQGDPRAVVARDMYYNRVKKFVGAYAAEMGGVDLIVFTGGVGENSRELRRTVCSGLEFMGVAFDAAANEARGEDRILSTPESRVKVAVIATDEELMIAADTYDLVSKAD